MLDLYGRRNKMFLLNDNSNSFSHSSPFPSSIPFHFPVREVVWRAPKNYSFINQPAISHRKLGLLLFLSHFAAGMVWDGFAGWQPVPAGGRLPCSCACGGWPWLLATCNDVHLLPQMQMHRRPCKWKWNGGEVIKWDGGELQSQGGNKIIKVLLKIFPGANTCRSPAERKECMYFPLPLITAKTCYM